MSPTMATPVQDTARPDHVKVRLVYETKQAVTESALLLSDRLGLPGPYGEEICILVPRSKVYSDLEVYKPFFQVLKTAGFLPEDARLTGYRVVMADQHTLAYVME